MAYKVLALKWRPNNFEEIIGQEHITKALQNAIKFNRVSHAFIFSGPRGVGKTSTARILAKELNGIDDIALSLKKKEKVSKINVYFPMQKSLKIEPKISSTSTFPTIIPKCLVANLRSSAAISKSLDSFFC